MNAPCRRRPLLALRAQQAASEPQQQEAAPLDVVHPLSLIDELADRRGADEYVDPLRSTTRFSLEITDPAVAEAARAMWSNTGDPSSIPTGWGMPKIRQKPGPKPGSTRKAR
jgi:hypothetical protein